MTVDPDLVAAVEAIWRIPGPGPDNLLAAPAFVALAEICQATYGGRKPGFGLASALRSLGLPCHLPAGSRAAAPEPAAAAQALDDGYRRKRSRRRHLCPLDLADELPPLAFGTARIAEFEPHELADLFDAERLARHFPKRRLDWRRLAKFRWLVVEEDVELEQEPEVRSTPFLYMVDREFGAIEVHRNRFPEAVEEILFFLMLAPWETWARYSDLDWRGFRIPWVHSVDDDLFVSPAAPPRTDTLTLEPWIVQDRWGEEHEDERPSVLPLRDDAYEELRHFDADAWAEFDAARRTDLFDGPVAHFLVRAFLAEGIDEFMAHMMVVEAGLGQEMDHWKRLRPKPDPHASVSSATDRVATRVAAILDDAASFDAYKALFAIRSGFVHGRAGPQTISSGQRQEARRIARGVARALIDAASRGAADRSRMLSDLLTKGMAILRPPTGSGAP